jgi:DNA-binding NarL/FixJ family response regulator
MVALPADDQQEPPIAFAGCSNPRLQG